MTHKQKRRPAAGHAMCLVAGTLIAGLGATASASAAEWKVGNIDFNMKSTLSAGTGMRVSNPKASNISVFNGGTDTTPAAENFDDGNLNFRRGDIFTASVRMLHEIDASWENYGAFVSVGYFYDFINSSESSTRRTDLSDATRSLAGRRIDLYDAYIYGDFDVGGSPLTVRLGNQVINWGEALFRPGGVSQTNAVDVGKLVTPGTNIREAYLPSPMIYANLGLTSGLSVEAYYQFMWRETRLIPVGTFHSTRYSGRRSGGLLLRGRSRFNGSHRGADDNVRLGHSPACQ